MKSNMSMTRRIALFCAALAVALTALPALGATTETGGLEDYRVTRNPAHPGDTMRTEARFSLQPDSDDVRLVLRDRDGRYSNIEISPSDAYYDEARDEYLYEFSFPVYRGYWTMTLYWSLDDLAYSHEREFLLEDDYYEDDYYNNYDWHEDDGGGCSVGAFGLGALGLCPLLSLFKFKRELFGKKRRH